MSIGYVLGCSGSGKTKFCVEEIAKKSTMDANIIYIVPEQFTLESEKTLCKSVEGTIIIAQVLSFQRLAHHLLSKTGKSSGKFLDEAGKNMLLRKVVSEMTGELTFYKKSIDKPGFIKNLSAAIKEFYQYDIDSEALLALQNKPIATQSLAMKLADITKIYNRYLQYISGQYILTETYLDMVPGKIENSKFLCNAMVWIDGFNGFTAQEYKIIEQLMKNCEKVTIAMTLKEKVESCVNPRDTDPFYEIKNMINKLDKLASDGQVTVEKPLYLKDNHRVLKETPLAFLEDKYFAYIDNVYDKAPKGMVITSNYNSYTEITHVAISILGLVRDQGYRYNEIVVITGNMSNYGKIIRSIFKLYDIPIFIDEKDSILAHPLTELILSTIDIVASNWSYESVFRFLKTSLLSMETDKIDILENYVLAYGIKGSKWKKDWVYGFENGSFSEEDILESKAKVMEYLLPFTDGLTRDKTFTVREYSVKMFAMLDALEIQGVLDKWVAKSIEAGDNHKAKEHGQIYGKICHVFDKMVEILGEEKTTPKNLKKTLEAGFEATKLGMIPPSFDQVIIGDMERSRFPVVKAMFVVGANEGVLPSTKKEEGFFSDDDRGFLNAMGLEMAPDSKRRTNEEQFLIYSAITKPTEKLYLSYALGTIEGKTLQPSSLITKIKKIFPLIEVLEEKDYDSNEITLPKPMFGKMGQALRDYSRNPYLSDFDKDLYNWFDVSKYAPKLRTMENILFQDNGKEYLSKKSTKKLYGDEIITGISRLEKYVACPFAYFVEYDLKAKERKLYQANAMDYGNIFHAILEDFSKRLDQSEEQWQDLTKEKIGDIVENIVEEITPKLSNQIMESTEKYKYIMKRISRISKRSIWALGEHLKRGSFSPMAAEVVFGKGHPITGISLNINNHQKLILTGRIDRVDVMDFKGNKYVKVIDYKSGVKAFDPSDLYYGMQLQLMMYLDAFIKGGAKYFGEGNLQGEILPGGVFYFNINDPIVEFNEEINQEKIEDMIFESFTMTGLVLDDEDIVKAMDKNIKGSSSVLPVSLTGTKGLTGKKSLVDIDAFNSLRTFASTKVVEICQNMVDGNINIRPYKKHGNSNDTGCTYCKYGAICMIDTFNTQDRYNVVKKIDDISQLVMEIEEKNRL